LGIYINEVAECKANIQHVEEEPRATRANKQQTSKMK
jgi:hypothetical protein